MVLRRGTIGGKSMPDSWQSDIAFGEAHYTMFPELRYFINGDAPMEDLDVYFRFQKGWPTVAVVAFSVVTAYPFYYFFNSILHIEKWPTITLLVFIQIVINLVMLSLVFPRIQQRKIRIALRARLHELGIMTCRRCAYDLRGSPDRCPECGTPN